jgi:hypothetical protein
MYVFGGASSATDLDGRCFYLQASGAKKPTNDCEANTEQVNT